MAGPNIAAALAEAKALVASLSAALESPNETNPQSNALLIQQTNTIRKHLEGPFDHVMHGFTASASLSATIIAFRCKLLQALPDPGSTTGVSATALAKQSGSHPVFIAKTMRMLVLDGVCLETDPDEYAHNELSFAYLHGGITNMCAVMGEFIKVWLYMPEYVKTHQPEDIQHLLKSPYACRQGHEGKTYFEVLGLDPEERDLFDKTLFGLEQNLPILGMFDFKAAADEARKQPDQPSTFMVDIGGGKGQALLRVREACGDGLDDMDMVLQDLPIVIDTLKEEDLPGIKTMVHDVFTPQPIKNAHIYYIRRFLHDFYSPPCVEILRNTASAMSPSSRLIICDMLVPAMVPPNGDPTLYWMDLTLMTIGGTEKTLAEFEAIFRIVGLEVVKIHRAPIGDTVNLELKLKTL